MIYKIDFNEINEHETIFTYDPKFWRYVGLAFFIAGILILLFMPKVESFECKRPENVCKISSMTIFGSKETEIPLEKVTGATTTTVSHLANLVGNDAFQLVIKTTDGDVNAGTVALNDKLSVLTNETKVNHFLKNKDQTSVSFITESFQNACCFGTFLPLAGLILTLISTVTLRFDGKSKKLTLRKKSLLTKSEKVFELKDILKFDKDMRMSSGESSRSRYRVEIVLKSNKTVPLTAYHLLSRRQAVDIVEQLNVYLRQHRREQQKGQGAD